MNFQNTLLTLFALFLSALCYDQSLYNTNLPIFEPSPTAIIDSSHLCSNGSTYNIALFNSNQRNMVALNLQLCGFAIFDITDIEVNIQLLKHFEYQHLKDQVISLSITNSDTFLWVGYSTGILEVYDVSQSSFPLVYSTNITYQNSFDNLNKVIQFPDLNLTFLTCLNNFKVINWENNNLQILRTYDFLDWNIMNIRLAMNQSVLIAQGFLSLSFYQQSIENLKQGNLNLICSYTPSAAYDLNAFEVIQESILVIQIDLYQYIMIDITNYIQSYDGKSCDPNKIVFLDSYPSNPQGGFFALSLDQKYLYTQQSSIGVYVFDVSQKKLQIFQIISTGGTSMDIQLSKDGQHLFYSNWFNTQIFKVTTPNLNLDVPNLLLNQYQLVSYTFYKGQGGSFDNQIIYQEPQDILYMTRKDQGSAVFQYEGDGMLSLISLLDYGLPDVSVAYQAQIPGTTLFYQSREMLGLQIVDYKDVNNPIVLKTNITLGLQNVKFEQIIFNKAGTLCFIANIIQLIIISIKDQLNPQVISTFETSIYLGGDQSLYKFSISNDEKTLLLFPELYGIVFADIQVPQNPQFLFKLYLGQIYFLQQTTDSQYLVCGVSFQGVFIYKMNSDRTLTLISSVLLKGVIYFQWLIYNDNYLIVTTAEIDSILLVNIVDKTNPIVTQIISLPQDNPIYWMLPSKDQSFIFASAQLALYQFFIQSPIIFHSQIYKLIPISNSNQYLREQLNTNQTFLVGDQIEIYLVNIYQSRNLYISKALYYINFVIQDLPSWMQFSPSDQILSILVSKDSLVVDSNGMYSKRSLQQVILLCYQQINDDDFVNQNLGITLEDSVKIKQACMNVGYLDKSGFVSPNYSPNNVFNLGTDYQSYQFIQKWNQTANQLQQVQNFIQFKLNQNIVNYVVQFFTVSSLIVDLDNLNSPIQSNQQQITVTIQVSNGLFVSKLYPGILTLINSEQNIIQIQGTVQSVNSVLNNKINLYLNETSSFNSTSLSITVDDQINYKYVNNVNLQNASFIKLQSPVLVVKSLQSDFNQQYDQGEISVQTPFNYKIDDKVFYCQDSSQLTYVAKIKIAEGQYQDLSSGYWLSFSSNERTFVGTPQLSQFNSEYTIQISVTDNYSITHDEFTIKVNQLPFLVFFQIMIQVVGPLLGIFGLWKYRTVFYNIVFRQFMVYTKEVAYVSENFEKNIIIADNKLEIGNLLWTQLRKHLTSNYSKQQIEEIIEKELASCHKNNQENQIVQKNNIITFYEYLQNQINPVDNQNIEGGLDNNTESKEDADKQNMFTNRCQTSNQQLFHLSQNSKRNPEIITETKSIYQFQQQDKSVNSLNRSRSQTLEQKATRKLVQIISKVQFLNKQQKNSKMKNQFLDGNGKINQQFITDFIIKNQQLIQSQNKKISKKYFQQLKNGQSRLSIILRGLAAEYYIDCSPICKKIIFLLKEKATQVLKSTDWYRAYVVNQPQTIYDDSFPIYKINKESFSIAFNEIVSQMEKQKHNFLKLNQNEQENNSSALFQKLTQYLPLIEEYLQAASLGIPSKESKPFQVSKGDCLYCSQLSVRSIKCYETNNLFNCCVNAQSFLEINEVEKGLSDNQRLPEWMQVDFNKSHIKIKGIPNEKSVGQLRIKIFDSNGYMIKLFDIQILAERKEKQKEELFQGSNLKYSSQQDNIIQLNSIDQSPRENFFLKIRMNNSDEILDDCDNYSQQIKYKQANKNSKNSQIDN
ncbi:hypothetical protein ABPG74_001811 [Tetrahymena malaccensis]